MGTYLSGMCLSDTERVERAATLLDQQRPGWFEFVDPASLDLLSPRCCVLGQAFAPRTLRERVAAFWDFETGYGRGVMKLRLAERPDIWSPVFAAPFYHEYWVTAILTRRHAQLEVQQTTGGWHAPRGSMPACDGVGDAHQLAAVKG